MSAFRPTYSPTWNPAGWWNEAPGPEQTTSSAYGVSPSGLIPGMGETGLLGTPFGNVSRSMWDQLGTIARGNLEQGLSQLLAQYGGVNPGLARMGFGQGLPQMQPAPQMQPEQIQQFLSQLLGPQPASPGSTGLMTQMQPNAAMAMPQMMNAQGGVTEEDALMNLLRRMAMGTGGY